MLSLSIHRDASSSTEMLQVWGAILSVLFLPSDIQNHWSVLQSTLVPAILYAPSNELCVKHLNMERCSDACTQCTVLCHGHETRVESVNETAFRGEEHAGGQRS